MDGQQEIIRLPFKLIKEYLKKPKKKGEKVTESN